MSQAAGQPQTPATTAEDRAQEFVAVTGGGESADAGTLLVAAYVLMWGALVAFIFMTWRRQRQLDARLDQLESRISKASND